MPPGRNALAEAPVEVRSAVTGSAAGWPLVLYFHHVHPSIDHYTSLTPDSFAHGLDTVLSLYGPALDPVALPSPDDGPAVLITFDDGHRDNLEYALPVLDRLGVKALFFVITGLADADNDASMRWTEVADLAAAGHGVGAHSMTHPKLPELSPGRQRAEIVGSLTAVRDRLGIPAPPFAYPYGLPPSVAAVPPGTFAFGTVKAPPEPWTTARQEIRRTYLPVGHEELWPVLCREWRKQWARSL
jgi:peptidoglycan/xylan/chitin deacetylase (PgdA/CDA1 family)